MLSHTTLRAPTHPQNPHRPYETFPFPIWRAFVAKIYTTPSLIHTTHSLTFCWNTRTYIAHVLQHTHTHSKRNFHVKHNVRARALSYHHPPHIYEREVDTGAKAHAADISKENVHDNTSVFLVMRANGKMCECNLYFQRKCDGTCGAVHARIWCQWIGANASIFLWLNGGWFFFYCTFNNNNRMLPFGFGVC